MMPSLATMRRFIYARLYCRGAVDRAELSLWLRREMEHDDVQRALATIRHERRALVVRGGCA